MLLVTLQLLQALRDFKQHHALYVFQCIFAVGPVSVLFLDPTSGSPFNVREALAVPSFSLADVSSLLKQFTDEVDLQLEDGIAADIHELTAGHAGLVCVSGRALERDVARGPPGVIKLASWRDFRARAIVKHALGWPTMRKLQERLDEISGVQLFLLSRFLAAGSKPLELVNSRDVGIARYLAAEGWLVGIGSPTDKTFRMASPLVRRIVLENLSMRVKAPAEALPLIDNGTLDVPAMIATVLRYLDRAVMTTAARTSSKRSRDKLSRDQLVPNEASYHSQAFVVMHNWLAALAHATLYSEADSLVSSGSSKMYADMLLIGKQPGAPKHLLELVASTDVKDIRDHYTRTVKYMAAHQGARGTCITFTAVASDADVSAVRAEKDLTWPSSASLRAGLEAIHVVHDVNWTVAAVFSKRGSAPPVVRHVPLT